MTIRLCRLLVVTALLGGLTTGVPVSGLRATASAPFPAAPAGLHEYVGAMHEHSAYSDGWPGTTPADYYASARTFGLDFLAGSEHSDNTQVPMTLSEGCLDPSMLAACPQKTPFDWEATGAQAVAASSESFTAIRGFEWTSDRYGHLNVYFSRNFNNAKVEGGYASMQAFWAWFTTRPENGGGADGLATFNHPGAKRLNAADPGFNWDDFAYEPAADDRMVGIEVYNDTDEFGSRGPAEGYYARALDKGWHVGAIGAEDLGHRADDDWGGPSWAKTVIMATDRSPAALRAAMLQRRFYAVRTPDVRLRFNVDGATMGARLARPNGGSLRVVGAVNDDSLTLEAITSKGVVVASAGSRLDASVSVDPGQRYYFLRAKNADGAVVAYSSPVWIEASVGGPSGEWLAGDLHVHTCYSHDAYCGPDDDNTGPEEFWTASGTVDERFTEASVRGLDYLAITDHNDVRSVTDPGFGTHGVIGVPGYENSIRGHAQMLGATQIYDAGDAGTAAVSLMADRLRHDGGVFQANHPADGLTVPLDPTCSNAGGMQWGYGFAVVPETVEVWNISHALQPPIPSQSPNGEAVKYWECWLQRGARVAPTGGSDSHWLSTSAIQGPGHPTTWVFASERSARGVLDGLRRGRTSVSFGPPSEGRLQLLLEVDGDGDGGFESMAGDVVPAGAPIRIRALGLQEPGVVTVRSNGTTVAEQLLLPGGELRLTAPSDGGWLRASLGLPDGADARKACDPQLGSITTYCRSSILLRALTAPVYATAGTTLRWDAPTQARGSVIEVAAVLRRDDGTPVSDRTVVFTAPAGGKVVAVTDSAGRAVGALAVPDHGRTQRIAVEFAGDARLRSSATEAVVSWGAAP